MLPKIEALLNEHKVFETELQSNITKMRTSLIELSSTTEFDTDKLKELEEATKAMKGGLKATFEAYPDLKSHNLYGSVMNEIAEQEENVGAAIRIYNSNVATFNTSIQTFPNSVINRNFTNKSEVEHFENETIESSLQFKPSFK
ncbi:LemA family protein [Vibrio anguillarum]|uniref:LemA family protein n=1 Tax=Vibrio anguillarum TaxID=55601 RepID=A0A7U6FS98_VIBAN|nr:LemA family protein [Vibrio anguillarum]